MCEGEAQGEACVHLGAAVVGHGRVDRRHGMHPRIQPHADVVGHVPPLAHAHEPSFAEPFLENTQRANAEHGEAHPLGTKKTRGEKGE